MLKGLAIVGLLLALQAGALQYYYTQKYEGLDPAACRAALANVAAAEAAAFPTPPEYKDCADGDERCEQWAASGECEKNPAFMIGTEQAPGKCVKACNKCPAEIVATEALTIDLPVEEAAEAAALAAEEVAEE